MEEAYSGSWWAAVLRGLLALVIGIFLIFQTGDTTKVLTQIFGIFAIIDGILIGIMAILGRKDIEKSWIVFLKGVIGFAIGLVLLFAPMPSLTVIIFLIALWLLVGGIIDLVQAWKYRKEEEGTWLLVAAGVIALLFGWILLRNPGEVTEFVLVLMGVFLVILGITETIFGFHIKGMKVPSTGG
jgi:uncharacterized membrane protein HdeD (DUF308 family)